MMDEWSRFSLEVHGLEGVSNVKHERKSPEDLHVLMMKENLLK
jgi:hypothetical protein